MKPGVKGDEGAAAAVVVAEGGNDDDGKLLRGR